MIHTSKNPLPLNGIHLCVNEIRSGEPVGEAYSMLTKKTVLFCGWMDMMFQMDRIFDQAGYPQAFEKKRSFQTIKDNVEPYRGIPQNHRLYTEIEEVRGEIVTLEIRVNTRRNTNWQGVVYLIDRESNKILVDKFFSEMELLNILNQQVKID